MTDRITEVLGALIASLEGRAKNSCPIATRDISVNLKNRQKAIDVAEYGPLNPEEPNEKYWKKLADIWDVSTSDAKKQRCGNCAAFIQTSKMKKCIEDGLAEGDTKENAWDTIKAGDLGYWGSFWSDTTQTITGSPTTHAPTAMTLNNTDIFDSLLSSSSVVKAVYQGFITTEESECGAKNDGMYWKGKLEFIKVNAISSYFKLYKQKNKCDTKKNEGVVTEILTYDNAQKKYISKN